MSEGVRAKSKALASAHAIVSGLHKLGLIDKETMREFDEACLKPPSWISLWTGSTVWRAVRKDP
jgi:putative transcriptional regulator